MRALTWHGKHDVRVDTVPDPEIVNPRDAIIKITSTAICGSDLHLYDHTIPTMKAGDVLGHEFMGEVVEVATHVSKSVSAWGALRDRLWSVLLLPAAAIRGV
jgi:threonine dehydrogenase-like Zn-dependent dehydrogenase